MITELLTEFPIKRGMSKVILSCSDYLAMHLNIEKNHINMYKYI